MPGEASKFAGRLNFASQKCFHRMGRAMVRTFYAQQCAPMTYNHMSEMLRLATDWWLQVLRQRVVQEVPMQERQTVGIDLPLSALAWEGADGQVTLSYNDLSWQLTTRHELLASQETVGAMASALETFTDAAVAADTLDTGA